ncbi:hypothetical protein JXA32_13065 [Candidatus Sumerlaeota bacterium]|nr:hypothetical protein [Candidatus Sumerlaeota bacterium]
MDEFRPALYFSLSALGAWAVIGYILLRYLQRKRRRREEDAGREKLLRQELGLDEPESLDDYEKLYRKKG